jgi:hypothetical protein
VLPVGEDEGGGHGSPLAGLAVCICVCQTTNWRGNHVCLPDLVLGLFKPPIN